jgi:hypothetical protein
MQRLLLIQSITRDYFFGGVAESVLATSLPDLPTPASEEAATTASALGRNQRWT